MSSKYTIEGRLQDVIALLQATGKRFEQDVKGPKPAYVLTHAKMHDDLKLGTPQSGDNWANVAREHPEFFRVTEKDITLIVRHLDEAKEPIKNEFISQMFETATAIYDRELQRDNLWTIKWPVYTAAIGVLLNIIVAFANLLLLTNR